MMLTLTRADVRQWYRDNRYAAMMFADAGSDYVAARCCIINTLFTGFRLASEAMEKILKAHIYLGTGAKTNLKRGDLHNPYALKQELNAARPDPKLDCFDDLLKKLYDHYQSRYFDNAVTGRGASSEELDPIDELFIYLVETLLIPEEAKYRGQFFSFLCEENARQHFRHYYWATVHNRALEGRMEGIERKYRDVFRHLYPTAQTSDNS